MKEELIISRLNKLKQILETEEEFDDTSIYTFALTEAIQALQQRDGDNKEHAIQFVESLREYERESRNLLGFDERETSELYEIFVNSILPTLPNK